AHLIRVGGHVEHLHTKADPGAIHFADHSRNLCLIEQGAL
ncbi:MAG: hypothetical protein AVDCRST_MAG68-2120, partial [uncultured Gemmatimonadetes bacterium]